MGPGGGPGGVRGPGGSEGGVPGVYGGFRGGRYTGGMVTVLLLMVVAGVALTQAVSDPRQVTLAWLRLGGVIALALLAVAGVMGRDGMGVRSAGVVLTVLGVLTQLTATQLGLRRTQRWAAGVTFLAAGGTAGMALVELAVQVRVSAGWVTPMSAWMRWAGLFTGHVQGGMLGGFIMTMLLGHAYLTSGQQMTQAPFRRLVLVMWVVVAARGVMAVALGVWPWWSEFDGGGMRGVWGGTMVMARVLVGLVAPGVLLGMVDDCVRRRANQSATGILYVTGVLAIIGEGIALMLVRSTGRLF